MSASDAIRELRALGFALPESVLVVAEADAHYARAEALFRASAPRSPKDEAFDEGQREEKLGNAALDVAGLSEAEVRFYPARLRAVSAWWVRLDGHDEAQLGRFRLGPSISETLAAVEDLARRTQEADTCWAT